jgi:hypothetical protein
VSFSHLMACCFAYAFIVCFRRSPKGFLAFAVSF